MTNEEIMEKIDGDYTCIPRYISDREEDFNAWIEADKSNQAKLDAIQFQIDLLQSQKETLQAKVELKASTVAQPTEPLES